jgi:hypothetical protein
MVMLEMKLSLVYDNLTILSLNFDLYQIRISLLDYDQMKGPKTEDFQKKNNVI